MEDILGYCAAELKKMCHRNLQMHCYFFFFPSCLGVWVCGVGGRRTTRNASFNFRVSTLTAALCFAFSATLSLYPRTVTGFADHTS